MPRRKGPGDITRWFAAGLGDLGPSGAAVPAWFAPASSAHNVRRQARCHDGAREADERRRRPGRRSGGPMLRRLPRLITAPRLAWAMLLTAGALAALAGSADPGAGRAASRPEAAQSLAGTRIRHVIEIMIENHTFDNLFGGFPGADGIPRTRRCSTRTPATSPSPASIRFWPRRTRETSTNTSTTARSPSRWRWTTSPAGAT